MVKVVWNKLMTDISDNGLEIKVFTIRNVKESYFMVYVKDNSLYVDRSIDNINTCCINTPRKITYKQFEDVYPFYDRYISGEKGIREKLRDINNNTTYILSLIKYSESL